MTRTATIPGVLAVALLGGCYFHNLAGDLQRIGDLGQLSGTVEVPDGQEEHPVHVVVTYFDHDRRGDPLVVRSAVTLEGETEFSFLVPPDEFDVFAFVDTNENRRLDDGEWFGSNEEPITVVAGKASEPVNLVLDAPANREEILGHRDIVDGRRLRTGEVTTLDDERLGPEGAAAGVWQPVSSLDRYPAGLFFLEEWDPERTPVVFVHGMGGHPREFGALIDRLDRERLQPWVFRYPSGFRLNLVARALRRALQTVHTSHPYPGACLVAHSMGGVVSRRFLGLETRSARTSRIQTFVTIASPLGGMDSAAAGVEMAPLVVPSWRDLASNSALITKLYETPLPEGLRYHLLFAFHDDGADDGTVALRSQVRREAQDEALVVRGFETTHVGALSDDGVAQHVLAALDDCHERSAALRAQTATPPAPEDPGGGDQSTETGP